MTAALRADLERYAALHARTYGEPVDAITLIPHMLEAFMARDRGFKSGRSAASRAVVTPQTAPETEADSMTRIDVMRAMTPRLEARALKCIAYPVCNTGKLSSDPRG